MGVDILELVGVGGREGEDEERLVLALEVEAALEWLDVGLDLAVSGDGGVDGHIEASGGRVGNLDMLDLEVGSVNLVLDDSRGHAVDAVERGLASAAIAVVVAAAATRRLRTKTRGCVQLDACNRSHATTVALVGWKLTRQ